MTAQNLELQGLVIRCDAVEIHPILRKINGVGTGQQAVLQVINDGVYGVVAHRQGIRVEAMAQAVVNCEVIVAPEVHHGRQGVGAVEDVARSGAPLHAVAGVDWGGAGVQLHSVTATSDGHRLDKSDGDAVLKVHHGDRICGHAAVAQLRNSKAVGTPRIHQGSAIGGIYRDQISATEGGPLKMEGGIGLNKWRQGECRLRTGEGIRCGQAHHRVQRVNAHGHGINACAATQGVEQLHHIGSGGCDDSHCTAVACGNEAIGSTPKHSGINRKRIGLSL